MRLVELVKGIVGVHIDVDTATLVQVVNKVTGTKHLFSRRPELELRAPGMGVVEVEPEFCSGWKVLTLTNDELVALCERDRYHLVKRVKVEEGFVEYEYRVVNRGLEPLRARARVAIYASCSRGGFWGDEGVEGATYTCRYFVDYGYGESWGTFSTTRTPGTPRGFLFEKHSYRERWFPEVRWVAVVDRGREEGLVIQCLSEGCYAVVEDQFFNVEINLALPARTLKPGEELLLSFRLVPVVGLTRVDYCDSELVVGVEGPSIVTPGSTYEGVLQVYPLKDSQVDVVGDLTFIRGMQSIGKRGYCVDRVVQGSRRIPLEFLTTKLSLKKYTPIKLPFKTPERLEWSFERELYEIPYVEVRVGDKVVKRAVSVNPDVEDAINYCPRELLKIARKYLQFNPSVESEFMEREASRAIYELVSKMRLSPRRIIRLKRPSSRDVEELALEYLKAVGVEKYVEMWQRRPLDPIKVSRTPTLELAIAYVLTGSERVVNAFNNLLSSFAELVFNGEFITYYSPVHGGGGVDRFVDFVIALDMLEERLDQEVVEDSYRALRLIAEEVSKLANTWIGNWELSEAAALLALSYKLGYPGSDIDYYRSLATAKRALRGFMRDGAWPELAASYHVASLSHIVKIAEFLRYTGGENLYAYTTAPGEVSPLKRALLWLWNILTPIHTTPALEDTNEFTPPPDIYALPGMATNDPDLLGIALKLYRVRGSFTSPWTYLAMIHRDINILNYEYRPPARGKIAVLEDSGRFIYRESEDENSLYLILDFGPQGGWHGHPDRLSFELYYNGEAVVVDAGSAGYYNPLHWTWSRRSIAHNTVTLGTSDLPEYARGRIVNYVELEDGFKASFQLDTDGFSVVRDVELRSTGEVKQVRIVDAIRGRGVFRWNLHCRGALIGRRGCTVVLKTPRGSEVTITPHDNVDFNLSEGFRGPSEKTIYLYYEKTIDGEGYMGGTIVIKR
jgi:hypothetical protein